MHFLVVPVKLDSIHQSNKVEKESSKNNFWRLSSWLSRSSSNNTESISNNVIVDNGLFAVLNYIKSLLVYLARY